MVIGCVYSLNDFNSVEKPLASPATIPFGISSIATVLKESGHEPRMFVLTAQTDLHKVIGSFINEKRPKLFCLTSVSSQYEFICGVARFIKRFNPSIFIIIGGHHASLNPEQVIENPDFDALCLGEGERAIVQYAQCLESGQAPRKIKNLWIRDRTAQKIEKNPTNDFIQELDALPFLFRGLWDEWIQDPTRLMSVLVGRGCPFKCSYCSNHAFAKISQGRYVRYRSPENVVREIRELLRRYPEITSIFLELETFSVNLNYAKKLSEELQEFNAALAKPIQFGVNVTYNRSIVHNDDLLQSFQRANIRFVNIGLESGSERIRTDFLRRPKYSNSEIKSFCETAKKFNIDVIFFVLIGIPGETVVDFRETVTCVRECSPKGVMLSIYYPYPGTDLHKMAQELGLLSKQIHVSAGERRVPTLSLPGFSRRQIRREYLLFYYHVYKGQKPLVQILAMTLRTLIGMYPQLNLMYRSLLGFRPVRMLSRKYSDAR